LVYPQDFVQNFTGWQAAGVTCRDFCSRIPLRHLQLKNLTVRHEYLAVLH
jgi:hypothetical protein